MAHAGTACVQLLQKPFWLPFYCMVASPIASSEIRECLTLSGCGLLLACTAWHVPMHDGGVVYVVVTLASINVVNRHWARLLNTWMVRDCLQAAKPSAVCVTSHVKSAFRPLLDGKMNISFWAIINEYLVSYSCRWAAYGSSPSAWSKGRQSSGAVVQKNLHSSREPGELSQWLWVMMSAP